MLSKIKLLNIEVGKYLADSCKKLGLTSSQVFMLGEISKLQKSGEVMAKDLEKSLNITKPSVTAMLNILEKDGYIERKNSEFDARAKIITFTSKSLNIKRDIDLQVSKLNKKICQGLTKSEIQTFNNILSKIYKNIKTN